MGSEAMGGWAASVQAFGKLPEAAALAGDPRPAWIWSGDGSRILWANHAGGLRLGTRSPEELSGRRYAPAHPLRRHLANAARLAGPGGTLARLRFLDHARASPLACRVSRIVGPDGEAAILVVHEATAARAVPAEPARVAAGAPETAAGDNEPCPPAGGQAPIASGFPSPEGREMASGGQSSAGHPPVPAWLGARLATFPAAPLPIQQEPGRPEPPAAAMEGDGETGAAPAVRFLWQTDGEGRFLFVSPGLAQVVGRNAEIVGESWGRLADRLGLDPSGCIAAAFARREAWSGLTAWWPAADGGRRVPVELTALPVFGGDGSLQGFRGFGVLRPATALDDEAFAGGVRPAPGSGMPAASGNVVPLHAGLETLPDSTRLSPQERAAFAEIAAALRDSLGSDAPWREAAVSGVGGEQDGAAAAAVAPPAEETAALAARLRHTEARLDEVTSILDVATDGVLILDSQGRIESLNGSAEALFGIEQSDAVGRLFADILTPDSRPEATRYFEAVREGGLAGLINTGRELDAAVDGGTLPLFVTFGRIGGEAAGRFCAVLRDLTQWKEAEADLVAARRRAEEASAQKSDFLARVSHEIRTPLNGIIGFAEVIAEERFGPLSNARYREYVRDIRTSGEHVLSLVNDLLDIAKIEAGKLELNFADVQLNDLARDCIVLMQPAAARARIILRSSLAGDLPPVRADARTMRQVILNLLSNAVKFTDAGGQVIVSTGRADGGGVVFRVRDTGQGMSESELVRALEPFGQLATAALADPPGTGLGLPLTKALVEANRAGFTISSAKGEGTIVKVSFPAACLALGPA